jgi:imidazolonepropionase-like amidohydrolase
MIMKKTRIISSLVLTLFAVVLYAQQTPADKQSQPISIVGATAHIGNGELINNATIVFEKGVITAIGDASTATKGTVIDASGKDVYPGFIALETSLGLVEVNAVRASDDEDELGDFIPHVRSQIAYNAESKVVESMRPNGILIAQVSPKGGIISGSSSVMQLDGWNWEDATVKVDDAIHLNWPSSFSRGRWWLGEDPGLKVNKNYSKQVDRIVDFLTQAKAYNKAKSTERNQVLEATAGLFKGTQSLYINADTQQEIIDGVQTAKGLGIDKIVVVGGTMAYKITDFLKENNVSVAVAATHKLPPTEDADYDFYYKLPKLLSDAGIKVGIHTMDKSNFQTRNLPFFAGQVVGQGMDKEEALGMITLKAAQMVGIDKNYGSLEVGKSATLFISAGDALDMRTNQIEQAFIDGRSLSLETHQTELYKRYSGKYGH